MDSLGKNTGVGCHALLQGIFPTQGSNLQLISLALTGGIFTTSTTWEASPSLICRKCFTRLLEHLDLPELHRMTWAAVVPTVGNYRVQPPGSRVNPVWV